MGKGGIVDRQARTAPRTFPSNLLHHAVGLGHALRSTFEWTNESHSLKTAPPMAFVSTTKPDEAKRFYTDVLGLEFVADDKFALIFRIHGNQTLRVQRVHELKPQPFTVFGWQVEDIESSVAILTKLGVMFQMIGLPTQDKTGVCTFDNGDKVAWFKDPDGNTLSIAQLVPN